MEGVVIDRRPRRLREALGLGIHVVAKETGIQVASLSRMERGERPWTLATLNHWFSYMRAQVTAARAAGQVIPEAAVPGFEELARYSERLLNFQIEQRKKNPKGAARRRSSKGGRRARQGGQEDRAGAAH